VPFTSPLGLLSLAVLATPPLSAEPPHSQPSHPDTCEAASPLIELTAQPGAKTPVVCISPDVPLTFRFNAPLQPDSERIEERERFEDVAPGQTSLLLVPPKNLEEGERFKVEVCFADGAAPECATFHLLGHPSLGRSQVKVFRQPRSVASFQEAEKEARAEVQQCREEVRQLRAARGVPEGLRGVFASGLVGEKGIASKDLRGNYTELKGNALVLPMVHSYRAEGRIAVTVWLVNPGAEPWTAAGAVLRGPKGEVLKHLPLWQPESILPIDPQAERGRQMGRVVVEALATEQEARGTYTLTLWDAERRRTVTLGNVTFP
jgi:uncharacterized protein (TIGR02268 family)